MTSSGRPSLRGPLAPGPRARLRPLGGVVLRGGMLGDWQALNRSATLPHCIERLEAAGAVENLRRAAGESGAEYGGFRYSDSDLHKVLEATGWAGDGPWTPWVDEVARLLAAAQARDGYLNSYYRSEGRFRELEHSHELYCLGHLIQAGIAHARTTGRRDILGVACRFADLIVRDGQDLLEGHPEPEMALVELYRETGREEYLALAGRMVDRRGLGQLGGTEYLLDHKPVREATEAVGHAVRQLYLACGVVDVYLQTGDETLLEAMRALWHGAFREKAYVTGGLGSRESGEAFGAPYELPPATAYAETCAAIAGFMFNWRMLLATGEARFADELERALYNGIAAGVGEDGRSFFYANPLESRGGIARQPWYACCCCPTNVARFVASLQHYVATGDDWSIQLHLLGAGRISSPAAELDVQTAYPWDGRVEIAVRRPVEGFELAVRIPEWCREATIAVAEGDSAAPASRAAARRERAAGPGVAAGGEAAVRGVAAVSGRYARVSPGDGDRVIVDLAMPPRLVCAHPRVTDVRGRVALARGPVVHCVEQADHDVPLEDLRIDRDRPPEAENGRLEGVARVAAPADDVLYSEYAPPSPAIAETRLTAIPYHRWGNRGPGAMRVWMPI